MRPTPRLCLGVAAGGAAGAVLRWSAGELVPDGSGFPWTTFAVNLSGSLLLALLPALVVVRRSPTWTAALGPGLLGGWTTLSTSADQGRALLADGQGTLAAAYLLGTLACSWVAVLLASSAVRGRQQQEPVP